MFPEKEEDKREDQTEADGERERDDVHGVRGLRVLIIAR
jgi:hypothetical protein